MIVNLNSDGGPIDVVSLFVDTEEPFLYYRSAGTRNRYTWPTHGQGTPFLEVPEREIVMTAMVWMGVPIDFLRRIRDSWERPRGGVTAMNSSESPLDLTLEQLATALGELNPSEPAWLPPGNQAHDIHRMMADLRRLKQIVKALGLMLVASERA